MYVDFLYVGNKRVWLCLILLHFIAFDWNYLEEFSEYDIESIKRIRFGSWRTANYKMKMKNDNFSGCLWVVETQEIGAGWQHCHSQLRKTTVTCHRQPVSARSSEMAVHSYSQRTDNTVYERSLSFRTTFDLPRKGQQQNGSENHWNSSLDGSK